MAMSLPLPSNLSLSSKILSSRSSPLNPNLSITLSPFRILLPPSKTLTPSPFSSAQNAISLPQDPIFLSHLQLIEEDHLKDDKHNQDFEEERQVNDDDLDPIRSFFKSRNPVPDPKHEGIRSWHITDIDPAESDLLDEEEKVLAANPLAVAEDGVVGEILRIARNLSENSTLGDFLDSYVGKIGAFECIELLARMGEEGLAWSCLFFFQWMGLQEPSLVTAKACTVLFTILGKAGMGEKLMIVFEKLPRTKQFRDVRLYNAAISGLSCCSR